MWCDSCGVLLYHSLTKYGIERELFIEDYDQTNIQRFVASGQDAAILANLAGGIGDLQDKHLGRLAQIGFATKWDCINGKGSWESNPWVWCLSFQRVDPLSQEAS